MKGKFLKSREYRGSQSTWIQLKEDGFSNRHPRIYVPSVHIRSDVSHLPNTLCWWSFWTSFTLKLMRSLILLWSVSLSVCVCLISIKRQNMTCERPFFGNFSNHFSLCMKKKWPFNHIEANKKFFRTLLFLLRNFEF